MNLVSSNTNQEIICLVACPILKMRSPVQSWFAAMW
nr:MAG TPA: hypothetical protein [Bacteriophage sp.]